MWTVVMALQVIDLSRDPAALSLVATCLSAGLVAVRARRRHHGGPEFHAHHHHRCRSGQHRRGRRGGTARRDRPAADLAHGGGPALLNIGAAFFFPAYSAYLPRILPAEQLLAANGVESVAPGPAARRQGWRWQACSSARPSDPGQRRRGGTVRRRAGAAGGDQARRRGPTRSGRQAAPARRPICGPDCASWSAPGCSRRCCSPPARCC